MTLDRRLIAKGRGEPFQALVEQGRYHAEQAALHAADLAASNWTAEQSAALLAEIVALDTDKNRQIDERSSAKNATRNEASAISEAKLLINSIRNVARQVVRKNPDAGVTLEDFNAGGPLGRVAGKISDYLGRLTVPAKKLDTAFAPFFRQQQLSGLVSAARAKLDAASTAQEVDIAALPEDTALVYERKGRILESIEDLNAIARNAFADAPEVRAKFNKDLLNRGRRPKKPSDGPVPAPNPS